MATGSSRLGSSRFLLASAGGLLVVGVCAGGVLLVRSDGPAASPTVRQQSGTGPAAVGPGAGTLTIAARTRSSVVARSAYKDGKYTVTGHYVTPGGDETIGVTVQLVDGVVMAAQSRTEARSPTARQFQEQFRRHIAVQVVARDLASLSVSRVAGASLTSVGFNDALARIRLEARK